MKLGRRMYLWIGLVIGPLAILGLKAYTKVTKAPRVRIIVESEVGKILLLKNVLAPNDQWTLPGGGVARGEGHAVAAQRELREETGIIAPIDSFVLVATLDRSESGLQYVAPVYKIECTSLSLPAKPINPREIAEIGWFDPNDLPNDTADLVHMALKATKKNNRGKALRDARGSSILK